MNSSKRTKRWIIGAISAPGLLVLVVTVAIFILTHRVEGHYFNSNGIRIHYTDEGEGTPVVLLHGFAVNADLNWRIPGVTEKLADRFRVIAMDLRGHGLSSKPHDPDKYGTEMVEDVIRLLDHLKIDKAWVAGYSLGGFIALKLAVLHPDRLFGVAPCGAGWEQPEHGRFLAALDRFADQLEQGGSIGPLAAEIDPKRPKPGFIHRLWVNLMTGYFNDKQALIAMIRAIPELAITREELSDVPVPVLAVVGEIDLLSVGAKSMEGVLPDLRLVIVPDADHMQVPGSDVLLNELIRFFSGDVRNAPSD